MDSDDSIGDPDYNPSSDESSDSQEILNYMSVRQPFVKLIPLQQQSKIRVSEVNLSKTKQSYCLFCFKKITKLSRHLELVHPNEERVKKFLILPKHSLERKVVITSIRNDGNFIYNTQIQSDGNLFCSRKRRQNQNVQYVPCANCKGFFSKNTLRRHFNKCLTDKSGKKENCMVAARKLLGKVHHKASEVMKEKILPVLRNDDVTRAIVFDELIILFGNKLCQKYRSEHHHNMIRARLRLLGRLLLTMKSECSKTSSLSDALHPKMYDVVIKSVNIVAGLESDGLSYKTPTNATNLGTFLKSCCRILITECIKNQLTNRQKEVADFLKLVEDDYGTCVNVAALENLAELKRQKPITLPSTEDIRTLLEYLRKKRITLYKKLKNEFDFLTWKECASVTLTTIQVFNRRRAGEIKRLKISDFSASQSVTDEMYAEIVPSLHEKDQVNADKYLRCQLRGKLGRNVSILIDKDEFKVLQLIIRKRKEAGVMDQNPYVFGLPGNQGVQRYLSPCRLLQKYSEECGASRPERLRGTHLRKHMATHSANYNLNDSEFMDLTNFMGHAEKIHKDHYRLPVATREITRISSILQKAQGLEPNDNISSNSNLSLRQEDVNDNVTFNSNSPPDQETSNDEVSANITATSLSTSQTNSSFVEPGTSNKKKRSVSPMGRVQRRSWTSEEITTVKNEFQQYLQSKSLPSISQCEFVKQKYSVLRKRTAPQIKTWLDNQIRKEQRKKERYSEEKPKIVRNKWLSPEKKIMLKRFHYYLDNQKLPTRIECIQIKNEEPILKNRSVEVIKAWINNENKKSKRME